MIAFCRELFAVLALCSKSCDKKSSQIFLVLKLLQGLAPASAAKQRLLSLDPARIRYCRQAAAYVVQRQRPGTIDKTSLSLAQQQSRLSRCPRRL